MSDEKDQKKSDEYFSSYFDLEVHKCMLEDVPRTTSYRDAILNNADYFKDKVVLDVGAGTGILSLFCMRAGARKVYAVEASQMAECLKDIVKANDDHGVIEVIHGQVEDVELPEKVDVLVSEWMGFYLLHESMLDSVLIARDKHLKEDGIMLPSHSHIYIAAASIDSFFQKEVNFWDSVYGFDMSSLKKLYSLTGKPQIFFAEKDDLLCEPQKVLRLDLRHATQDDISSLSQNFFVSISKDATFRSLVLWFDCEFAPANVEKWRHLTLSTSVAAPKTHWKQTVVMLPEEMDVEEGDVVGWRLEMGQGEENKRHYGISVEILDPGSETHPVPCSCQMAKCALIQALLSQEDELDGEIIDLTEAVDGGDENN